jgi:predicted SprT family Zn-dependent metalloprotease
MAKTRRVIHMPADTDLNHLFRIWSDATALLDKYGLTAKTWKVVYDNTKRRGGECRYLQREIGISIHLFTRWTYEEAMQTVLHEIAHALCPGHGHDKVWKAKAREIGHSGNRHYDAKKQGSYPARKHARNWIGTCPNGHKKTRARKPLTGRNYSCGTCSPGKFSYGALLKWRKAT